MFPDKHCSGLFNTKTHPSINLKSTVQYVLNHNSLRMPVCKQTTFVTLSCIVSVCQQCVGGNYIRWQHKEGLKQKQRPQVRKKVSIKSISRGRGQATAPNNWNAVHLGQDGTTFIWKLSVGSVKCFLSPIS